MAGREGRSIALAELLALMLSQKPGVSTIGVNGFVMHETDN